MPSTPVQVHHHTGGGMIAHLPYSFDNQGSKPLPKKKKGDQKYIGKPGKSQMGDNAKRYHKDHRNMYGQKPLPGESIHVGPPVSERNIDQKYDHRNNKKFHVEANIPKNNNDLLSINS
jgi:hypothetical protein